jgi:hypothetical protein
MRRSPAWLLLALALVGCPVPPPPPCPSGSVADATLAERIEHRLARTMRGRVLLDTQRVHVRAFCFVPPGSTSAITDERDVLLARDLEEGEAAARLAHLLTHLDTGLPSSAVTPTDDAAACDAMVEHAISLEAAAYVAEIDFQDALVASPRVLRFEFADAVRAASILERERIVHDYLYAHPSGAPGIDGLVDAYRARCRP